MGGTVHPDEFHYRRLGKPQSKTYPHAIPLRRLSSRSTSASVATQNDNPFETASIISTNASLISHASYSTITPTPRFIPTSKLQVQTSGHGFWALPFVIHNAETVIFTLDDQNRCQRPKWISIRREKGLGNFWIHDAEDETKTDVARAVFKFGPTTDPRVRIGKDVDEEQVDGGEKEEFEIKTKWMSRTTEFMSKERTYQWRYGDKKERMAVMSETSEDVHDLLLLEEIGRDVKGKPMRTLARFIRGEKSRTPGTKKSHAGNGGRLEMAIDDEEAETITELIIITSLLVMLKREIDRLRSGQIAGIVNSKGLAAIAYGVAYAAGYKVSD